MTTLTRGSKIEITEQLSTQSAETLARWAGCAMVVWNAKVLEQKRIYSEYRLAKAKDSTAVLPPLSQAVAHLMTEETAFLREIPSQIRRNVGTKFAEAMRAFIVGLKKPPTFKSKFDVKKCLVTNELFQVTWTEGKLVFRFKKTEKSPYFATLSLDWSLEPASLPKMVWISRQGRRFWLSFSYLVENAEIREESDILESLQNKTAEQQAEAVLGLDLGVKRPVTVSNGAVYGYTPQESARLLSREWRKRKYQRKLSRQREMAKALKALPGKNQDKTKSALRDVHAHVTHIRINMAHRVSKMVAETTPEVLVIEKLNISNMTKRPKAKLNPETGQWERKGARAKAGLNKSILNTAWGRIISYLSYKLRERDKCLVKMPPHYSSQECFLCEHIAAENRKTQEKFCCQRCGHVDNADENAAKVLKKRFLLQLNTGQFVFPTKTVKRIALRRQKADRTSVSVCGAKIRPVLATGAGCETETCQSDLRSSVL